MQPERRPLQLVPQNLNWEWQDSATLVIEFTLGAGQYATTLLADVFALQDLALSRLTE
jgi:tRNA pseudouridine13 synthase